MNMHFRPMVMVFKGYVVHGPAVLLPALSVLRDGLPGKIIPRIPRILRSVWPLPRCPRAGKIPMRDAPQGAREAATNLVVAAVWLPRGTCEILVGGARD